MLSHGGGQQSCSLITLQLTAVKFFKSIMFRHAGIFCGLRQRHIFSGKFRGEKIREGRKESNPQFTDRMDFMDHCLHQGGAHSYLCNNTCAAYVLNGNIAFNPIPTPWAFGA